MKVARILNNTCLVMLKVDVYFTKKVFKNLESCLNSFLRLHNGNLNNAHLSDRTAVLVSSKRQAL